MVVYDVHVGIASESSGGLLICLLQGTSPLPGPITETLLSGLHARDLFQHKQTLSSQASPSDSVHSYCHKSQASYYMVHACNACMCTLYIMQMPQVVGQMPKMAVAPSPDYPAPHDFLMLAMVTTIICGILNCFSLALGIPAIILAAMVNLSITHAVYIA